MHGGTSPAAGPLHPTYRTGRRSKYLPKEIAARVGESLSDPDLLSARFEAALLEARCNELMTRLATGESGVLWKRLQETWGLFQSSNRQIREAGEEMQSLPPGEESQPKADKIQARIQGLRKQATEAITMVGKLIDNGADAERSWRELIDLSHEAVRMKQIESDRMAKLQMTMTAEEAIVLVHNLQQIIVRVVTNKKEQYEIGRQMAALLPGLNGDRRPEVRAVDSQAAESQVVEPATTIEPPTQPPVD